jgi:hypothetical protein
LIAERATTELTFVDSLFEATDLVPNAKQQQTFEFTLDSDLLQGQKVSIKPTPPSGQADYSSASLSVDDESNGGKVETNNGNIGYKPDSDLIPAGTNVEIRVT